MSASTDSPDQGWTLPHVADIHLFFHFLYMLNPIKGCAEYREHRVHPGQVASPSQGHTETNETNNHAYSHSLLESI